MPASLLTLCRNSAGNNKAVSDELQSESPGSGRQVSKDKAKLALRFFQLVSRHPGGAPEIGSRANLAHLIHVM